MHTNIADNKTSQRRSTNNEKSNSRQLEARYQSSWCTLRAKQVANGDFELTVYDDTNAVVAGPGPSPLESDTLRYVLVAQPGNGSSIVEQDLGRHRRR